MKRMKQWVKNSLAVAATALFGVAFFTFSCSAKQPDANTAFAESKSSVKIPANALSIAEALQTVNRAVSDGVLPSVVELDVVETKVQQIMNPFEGFPFFFFNQSNEQGEQREYKQQGLGSGVIVRQNGKLYYVLTNNHVAGKASEISVKLNDGRIFTGKLVGADERKDIALVSFECDDNSIPVAVLGNSDAVRTGDICFAMGTPLGYYSSVTQGIVSATGRSGAEVDNINDFIQTDAAINQGNSGGPLVNIYGEIIGINTWISSQSGGSQGLGFAIPINNVKKAIDDFISGGKITYGWMGIQLTDVVDSYKAELGVKNKNGVLAAQVYLGSPAAKAGVQAGDYIIALNGKDVKSSDQLVREVGDLPVGQKAVFTLIRGGKQMTVTAIVEERTDATVTDSSKLWPGFIAAPVTPEIRKELKLNSKVNGVAVASVQAKSPAATLGLQVGDIITAVNGQEVKEIKDFYATMDLSDKKEIWFDIVRDGHSISTVKYRFDRKR